MDTDNIIKANLIKESLKIVDILAGVDTDMVDNDVVIDLIERAKKLKKNRYWRLN